MGGPLFGREPLSSIQKWGFGAKIPLGEMNLQMANSVTVVMSDQVASTYPICA